MLWLTFTNTLHNFSSGLADIVDEVNPLGSWNVDPNEPRYCLCNDVSYGEMVGCDNEDVSVISINVPHMKLRIEQSFAVRVQLHFANKAGGVGFGFFKMFHGLKIERLSRSFSRRVRQKQCAYKSKVFYIKGTCYGLG